MTATGRATILAVMLAGMATPARAQMGEMQFGVITAFGPGGTAGPTPGLVVGVAAGRLVYVGLRGTRYREHRVLAGPLSGTTGNVTYSATALATDLAVVIPLGETDFMVGVSVGAVRHIQHTVLTAASGSFLGTTHARSVEFMAAPGLALEIHAGPVAFIPELQFQFSGQTDLPFPVRRVGWLASLRFVVPVEVGRIRT